MQAAASYVNLEAGDWRIHAFMYAVMLNMLWFPSFPCQQGNSIGCFAFPSPHPPECALPTGQAWHSTAQASPCCKQHEIDIILSRSPNTNHTRASMAALLMLSLGSVQPHGEEHCCKAVIRATNRPCQVGPARGGAEAIS